MSVAQQPNGGSKRLALACQSSARMLSYAALFPLALAISVSAVSTGSREVVTWVGHFEPLRVTPDGDFTRVAIADCDQWQQPGAPLVPFRTVRLLLPAGGRIAGIRAFSTAGTRSLSLGSKVDFGKLPLRRLPAGVGRLMSETAPDPSIYNSEQAFPAKKVELASVQRLDGLDIAILRVFPAQYLPLRDELEFTPELRVEVEVAHDRAASPPPVPLGPGGLERVAAMIDNPGALLAADLSPRYDGEVFGYLLITSSNLVTAFQPLLDLKIQQGLTVQVQTIETLTNTFPGVDLAERIRNCIRDAYLKLGVRYVLLGGDTTALPSRTAYVYMGPSEDPYVATDMYYACLDGSWNGDGDARWGEPTDGEDGGDVDLLAEVSVGRAPVDTVAEASIFVEKTVRYETGAHPFLTNALFLAEVLNPGQNPPAQGGRMFAPLEPFFDKFRVTWLDDRFTVPRWKREDAVSAMNQSPHLVLFNGHGNDYTLIGAEDPFTRSIELPEINSLANQHPFLAYSVGCDVGWFDNHKSLPDSIGEELIKLHSRGAFAAVFNSRFGWYDPLDEAKYSGEFQFLFFTNVLARRMPNLGDANQFSKEYLLGKVEDAGIMTYRYCFYEISYFGDPHVEWRSAPAAPAQRQLTVASAHAAALPPAGSHSLSDGATVTCQVTSSPLAGPAGIRYVCTGWTGTGSVPAYGSSTQVTFVITADSQLTWLWKTQALLTVNAGPSGSTTGGGWFDTGTSAAGVGAVAAEFYHFSHWTGDVPAGAVSNATLQVTMDRPRTLQANFAENLTSMGTPEWWLAGFGWTGSFESAAAADADNDGMAAWQEYVAGTNPTNPLSVLRVGSSLALDSTAIRLEWPSTTGRRYSLWGAPSPNAGFTLLTNNLAATPPINTHTQALGGEGMRFFRLGVERVP